MARFNYNLRSPGKLKVCPINLIIRYQGYKLVYPTGERIEPFHWQGDSSKRGYQRAKQSNSVPEYFELNSRLDFIETTAKTVFRRYINDNEGEYPTIHELRQLLNEEFKGERDKKKMTLFRFIENYIEQSEHRYNHSTGKTVSRATLQAYSNSLRVLKEYEVYSFSRVDFDTIDIEFYDEFVAFLTHEKSFSPNTIGKHLKILKTFLNEATERHFNSKLDYRSKRFKIISEESDAIYLNEFELKELYELDLSEAPRLERVRDLFLVGCWTGLRFSDFVQIRKEDIKGDFLEIRTQKTGEKVVVPIHPVVNQIMKKYPYSPNNLPPEISNAKMNKYLKEVSKMVRSLYKLESITQSKGGTKFTKQVEKHKLVTTHTARRSFATNLYKAGFPSISIMKITGHRTERAFLTYIKITPDENAKLLKAHWLDSNQGYMHVS